MEAIYKFVSSLVNEFETILLQFLWYALVPGMVEIVMKNDYFEENM